MAIKAIREKIQRKMRYEVVELLKKGFGDLNRDISEIKTTLDKR